MLNGIVNLSDYKSLELTQLNNTLLAFEIITSICIIVISIPQLVKILKEKKTENISFTSFWIFHLGILFWIIFATFAPGPNYLSTLISETIAILINAALMFCIYWYLPNVTKKKLIISQIANSLTVVISIVCMFLHFFLPDVRMNGTVAAVLNLIGPAGVTLPFTPQLIKSFKTKQWEGISVWLLILYTINNIAWIVFFAVGIKIELITSPNTNNYLNWVGGLVWQVIGFILFDIQLWFTVKALIEKKKLNTLNANTETTPLKLPESTFVESNNLSKENLDKKTKNIIKFE